MGMFDYVVCEMPLPGTNPVHTKTTSEFQTKDTPAQGLETCTIGSDGRVTGAEAEGMTGTIDFYGCNTCGHHGPITYTPDGEDAESVAYQAKVVDGVVVNIEQTDYSIGPAWKNEPVVYQKPTPEEIAAREAYEAEPLVGRVIHVRYGGDDKGYSAEVLVENEEQLCIRLLEDHSFMKAGRLEIIDRWARGRTWYDTAAEADTERAEKSAEWDALLARWNRFVADWMHARGVPA